MDALSGTCTHVLHELSLWQPSNRLPHEVRPNRGMNGLCHRHLKAGCAFGRPVALADRRELSVIDKDQPLTHSRMFDILNIVTLIRGHND
jgi:hypothetical protein